VGDVLAIDRMSVTMRWCGDSCWEVKNSLDRLRAGTRLANSKIRASFSAYILYVDRSTGASDK